MSATKVSGNEAALARIARSVAGSAASTSPTAESAPSLKTDKSTGPRRCCRRVGDSVVKCSIGSAIEVTAVFELSQYHLTMHHFRFDEPSVLSAGRVGASFERPTRTMIAAVSTACSTASRSARYQNQRHSGEETAD